MPRCSKTICANCPTRDFGICSMVRAQGKTLLSQLGRVQDYPANKVISDDETASGFTGALISGYLRLQRYGADGRRQILSLLTPGDIVSGPRGRSVCYTIETSTDARICRFNARLFDQLLDVNPELRRMVYRLQTAKLDQLRWLTWSLGALNVEERLCAFLAMATNHMPYDPLPGGGGVLTVDLPRHDIADLLGTTVESISRITNHLDETGVIRILNARQFEIPDLDRLVAMGCLQGTIEHIRFPSTLGLRALSLRRA